VTDSSPALRASFGHCLVDAALSSVLALALACCLAAATWTLSIVVNAALGASSSALTRHAIGAGYATIMMCGMLGLVPCLLVGAPAYALLRHAHMDGYWSAALLGGGMGCVMLGIVSEAIPFWPFLVISPILVGALTHRLSLQWRKNHPSAPVNRS